MGILADLINQFFAPVVTSFGSMELIGYTIILFIIALLYIFRASLEVSIIILGVIISAFTVDGIVSYVPAIVYSLLVSLSLYNRLNEQLEGQ